MPLGSGISRIAQQQLRGPAPGPRHLRDQHASEMTQQRREEW